MLIRIAIALIRKDACDLHSATALIGSGISGIPKVYKRPTFTNPINRAETIRDTAAGIKLLRVGITTVMSANAVITPSKTSTVVAFINLESHYLDRVSHADGCPDRFPDQILPKQHRRRIDSKRLESIRYRILCHAVRRERF